jgi:hypothetical protein
MSKLQTLIDRLPISDDERVELRREIERANASQDGLWMKVEAREGKLRYNSAGHLRGSSHAVATVFLDGRMLESVHEEGHHPLYAAEEACRLAIAKGVFWSSDSSLDAGGRFVEGQEAWDFGEPADLETMLQSVQSNMDLWARAMGLPAVRIPEDFE